jgi:type VI secretion system secreted protein VgrG
VTISQINHQLRIKTPLGIDTLLLCQFEAHDEQGRLFECQAELLSEDDTIPLDTLLGKGVDIELGQTSSGTRYLNAFVSSFTQVEVEGELFHYLVWCFK